jgi:transcriptional regulator with XRE-family HTH domain
MLSTRIAGVLRTARKALGLSQKELACRVGVSHRLWAEVERGERPNVSLETALRMLREVGVTVRPEDLLSSSRERKISSTSGLASRAARAAIRRATWQGRQIRLGQEGDEVDETPTGSRRVERLAAVGLVSQQAFAVANARRVPMQKHRKDARAAAKKRS